MNSNRSRLTLYLPFLLGAAIASGVFIGYFLSGTSSIGKYNSSISGVGKDNKLSDVLNYIIEEYVDTINTKKLEEDAIVSLLQQLDPHSAYIPAAELQGVSEQLEGNFDGIGVEFNIQHDTIMVVAAITGGPSESLGIQSGDRIVRIEGKSIAGIGVKNEDVIKKLRGKRDTKVKVGIYRPSTRRITDYVITRGQIPIYSVDASYMATPDIGYIKISRFAATTYDEYLKAFNELSMAGMKKLILDLRDNPGGYLNAAVDLCDEFLPKGKKIVYTQGKARKREDFDATAKGGFESGGLVILIDEGSASASEIVSGAVQDNDRGWVVGRRSFGKGLVQEEVRFDDSSAMRLTIARYYTPTGRCIQKSYKEGSDAYYHELGERYSRGEMASADSMKSMKGIAFKTPAGRVVYGGGGIMPDVFVPIDTSGYSIYLSEIAAKGLINQFVFEYVDSHREEIKKQYKSADSFARGFPVQNVLSGFSAFTIKNGIKSDPASLNRSSEIIRTQILALMGRALYGNKGFYSILNGRDKAVLKAIELLNSNKLVSNSANAKTSAF
jgi:carboxyl-terminal processing protease